MALAPVAYTLWQHYLRFDPADPIWPNRDRFVLSAGHASMLLYSLLHLAGVQGGRPRLRGRRRARRQPRRHRRASASSTRARPGHPEYRWTSGVETTTGPLGQGIATSVGMAIASKWQGARYGAELFDFDVYAIGGDGCLMEGVSHEAASLAGHLKLDNLCWIYDNNHITIDGNTELAYERRRRRPLRGLRLERAPGRRRQRPRPARARLRASSRPRTRPPDADRRRQPHRLRLAEQAGHRRRPRRAARRGGGAGDQARLRLARGRPVPRPRRRLRALRRGDRQARRRAAAPPGSRRSPATPRTTPTSPPRSRRCSAASCPTAGTPTIPTFDADEKGIATRKASNKVQNAIARAAALAARPAPPTSPTRPRSASTSTAPPTSSRAAYAGRQLHFGIREHESAAISNGLSLSKLRPLWSTYLTFSDYARPAIRLSALMELPVIHLFTHDSIGLGEDGPTHQPVEQLASPAGDPRPRRDPARRRQRGRRGLAGGDRPHPPAGGAGAHPPGRADPRPLAGTPPPRGCGAAATCSPTPRAATPR